ncbi:cellulase family glycosylhydrolase [Algoriphagus antarcticus]|uniref:Mannan endo-1,4-beta-mannosidase n=1 Tax=Algoriphagus antarcticus TaxID=238540 RepID=A0A3E0E5I0_9BACT|nr:cellulase family glycosylhydrolase [Algoriphagus antarcticus]REG92880.1 mannan endo-1,4-beta-mannosidase [Algoriphagus antarcticus]
MHQFRIVLVSVFLFLACSIDEGDSIFDPMDPEKSSWSISVSNGNLVDSEGKLFIPYGFNSVHVWLDEAQSINALKNEMPKSGANTVRIVASGSSWTWNQQSNTASKRRKLIEAAIEGKMVPMLEFHDGTCMELCDLPAKDGKMGLKQIVDEWLEPANLQLLKDYEGQLMVNIANEWGPEDRGFLDCYKDAISRLRSAGVKNVLVIDAGRCGQSANTLLEFGDQLFDHDPLKNLVLSIHMYGFWTTEDKTFSEWTPPFDIETFIPRLANLKAPVIVGEFGWEGEGSSINYDPKKALQIFHDNQIGWLFWAWYDGKDKPFFNATKDESYRFNKDSDLTDAGRFIIHDPKLGMKVIAKKPSNM